MPSSFKKGFTLIELLVGITIMSVILGMGAVSYRSFYKRQQVKQVAETLKTDLRFAQSQAFAGVSPGTTCAAVNPATPYMLGWHWTIPSSSSYSLRIRCTNSQTSPTTVYELPVQKTVDLPSGITLQQGTALGLCFVFRTLGKGIVDCGSTPSSFSGDLIITVTNGTASDNHNVIVRSTGEIL